MDVETKVEILDNQGERQSVSLEVARLKVKKLHFFKATLVEWRRLQDDLVYHKIAMSPGMVGFVVANQISSSLQPLVDVDLLRVDLRGDTREGAP